MFIRVRTLSVSSIEYRSSIEHLTTNNLLNPHQSQLHTVSSTLLRWLGIGIGTRSILTLYSDVILNTGCLLLLVTAINRQQPHAV